MSQQTGSKIHAVPVDKDGNFDIKDMEKLINKKTKIISVPHVSNVLGTVFPVKEISKLAMKLMLFALLMVVRVLFTCQLMLKILIVISILLAHISSMVRLALEFYGETFNFTGNATFFRWW